MSHDVIDQAILECCEPRYRKVMRIAYDVVQVLEVPKGQDISFLGPRFKALVEAGELEADGNLDRWDFSEIRLPEKGASTASTRASRVRETTEQGT
jgi:hypothetical protein